ncbi:MAG: HAD domain-containing protein [bacterium]
MKKTPKYIFLDIDGVIATNEMIVHGMWGLNNKQQDLLGFIIEQTDAQIVLTSSWRHNTLEDTIDYMNEKGFRFCDRIIGITIRGYHYIDRTQKIHLSIPRGVEIKQWIDTHIHSDNGKNYERQIIGEDWNYVIIDDDFDMLLEHQNNFVHCDWKFGLTKTGALKAIEILNGNFSKKMKPIKSI